jgi:ABC-type transport system involved in multi-copper enzyme maturation permease subunit
MRNLIQAEFKKIFFQKSSKVYMLTLILVSLVLGLIFSLTTSVTQGKAIVELSSMDVLSSNILGVDMANIMLIIFTAMSISKEFTTKLINISLAITPNRKRFYLGKVITFFILSAIISIVIVLLSYSTSQLILAANKMPLVTLRDNAVRQFIIGVMIMPLFYAIITVAATFIFKSSAGAITFSLVVMIIPALVKMFSDSIQRILLPIFPQTAIHSLSGAVEKGSAESIGVINSIIVLLMWVLLTSLVARISFQKEDL